MNGIGFLFGMTVLGGVLCAVAGGLSAFAHPPFSGGGDDLLWIAAACAVASLAMPVTTAIQDHLHNKKVDRDEAMYRLPFWKRWAGWQLGHVDDDVAERDYCILQNKTYHDKRTGRKFSMHRWNAERLAMWGEIAQWKRERRPGWSHRD